MFRALGGLSVAVPGEVMGYWEAHKKYGTLPWEDLFWPAIHLCRDGITVSKFLARVLKKSESTIQKNKGLR